MRLLAQGTELAELAREDRLANALADERGALALPERVLPAPADRRASRPPHARATPASLQILAIRRAGQ